MKWQYKSDDDIYKEEQEWHKYFCWWPTIVNKNYVWFETVERRAYQRLMGWGYDHTFYEYRLIEKT